MCRDFWSELLYFCVSLFQFTDAPFGSILPLFPNFFCCIYYVYVIKMSNSVLEQNFRLVSVFLGLLSDNC